VSRVAASDRLERLLSIVPWIVDHPGAPVAEICDRFSIAEGELLAALEMLRYVGVHPFSPDALIDVVIEDAAVWLHLAQPFGRPLRLTPEEGLALVAAGRGMVRSPGADPNGSLARGLAKLSQSLGLTDDESIEVRLGGSVVPEILAILRTAIRDRRRVAIDYYSHGRDEQTAREISPHQVYADQGHWYAAAWCHQADAERIFRVDRIQVAEALDLASRDRPAEVGSEQPGPALFRPGPDTPRVALELGPDARWVPDHYPHEDLEDLGGGRFRITLAVTARPWLDRLLLSLGPDATVLEVDGRLGTGDVRSQAAGRVLARYGSDAGLR